MMVVVEHNNVITAKGKENYKKKTYTCPEDTTQKKKTVQ
jgi:hypothetical protein